MDKTKLVCHFNFFEVGGTEMTLNWKGFTAQSTYEGYVKPDTTPTSHKSLAGPDFNLRPQDLPVGSSKPTTFDKQLEENSLLRPVCEPESDCEDI